MRDSQGKPDVAQEQSAESEATAQLAAAESARASARASSRTSSGTAATERASARTSKRFVLPDDRREQTWRVRHAERIRVAELVLTAAFLAAAGYFLYLWFFPASLPTTIAAPTRADFRAALFALPPAAPAADWRVAATPGRWRMIVVHHTATVQGDPVAIDRYHRENNKWENGLGYHFLIGNGRGMPDGTVFVGGRWTRQLDGAHVRAAGDGQAGGSANANSFSIGIALVGNFESTLPTPAQLAALRGLLAFLMREYAIPASGLLGHGELSARPTACPGEFFYMEEVKRALLAD